jgi:hypothetical protein
MTLFTLFGADVFRPRHIRQHNDSAVNSAAGYTRQ